MNVCPKCGLPFEKDFRLEQERAECDYCGWSGMSSDTLVTGSSAFAEEDLSKLRRVFVRMAQDVSPRIMGILIKEKFFVADMKEVPRMVRILSATTRAMFSALVTAMCEEDSEGRHVGDDSEAIHS